jgi:hypothetical protein
MKRFFFLMVFSLVLSTALFSHSIRDLFPLAVGYQWVFTDTLEDGSIGTSAVSIIGTEMIEGRENFLYVEITDDDVDTSYLQYRADGLYTLVDMEGYILDVLVAPTNFNTGDTWVSLDADTVIAESGYDIHAVIHQTMRAVRTTNITVPAGFFADCVEIQTTQFMSYEVMMGGMVLFSDSGTTYPTTMWLARNTGVVKSIDEEVDEETGETLHSTSVLISFSTAGIGDKGSSVPEKLSAKIGPNPFNGAVSINVSRASELEFFDLSGRLVDRASTENGKYVWHPNAFIQSGVYLVKIKSGEETITKNVIYIR